MVDAMDTNLDRLMFYLESIDEHDNAIFVFVSDNGAASSTLLDSDGNSLLETWFTG
ncbi:MAG: arylsulfatase A-like enzyme [Pseudohongiellaceae bacterium]|jgi:arylsulfatase A-like enzyme